jgi:prepilin-type N-terminal cleavage/methylation domain-containing protein
LRYEGTALSARSGISLLEMLVVLAVLAAIAALALPRLGGPSPRLDLKRQAADWSARIAQARYDAVSGGRLVALDLADSACEGQEDRITVFPDGVVQGPDLCLTAGEEVLRLHPATLTGHLGEVTLP